jgi:hypothetical protein
MAINTYVLINNFNAYLCSKLGPFQGAYKDDSEVKRFFGGVHQLQNNTQKKKTLGEVFLNDFDNSAGSEGMSTL